MGYACSGFIFLPSWGGAQSAQGALLADEMRFKLSSHKVVDANARHKTRLLCWKPLSSSEVASRGNGGDRAPRTVSGPQIWAWTGQLKVQFAGSRIVKDTIFDEDGSELLAVPGCSRAPGAHIGCPP